MGKRRLRVVVVTIGLVISAIPALAGSTYVGPALGTWADGSNWSPTGVPGANTDVNLANSDGVSRTLVYNYSDTAITLGTVTIDQSGNGVNKLVMETDVLSANIENIGKTGRGAIEQSGGVNSVGQINIGVADKANGTYTLSGNATLAGNVTISGGAGHGVFNQNGGTFTGGLSLGIGGAGLARTGFGTFNLNDGTLTVGTERVDGTDCVLNQTGGDNTANNLLLGAEGTGTFNLEGGTLTVLGYPTPNGLGENIGYFSSHATFNQKGGVHVVKAPMLLLAYAPPSVGNYNLSGGSLMTPLTEIGAGAGTFTQTGGTHTTSSLVVGTDPKSRATYAISDGQLLATQTTNNGSFTQTGGTASLGPVDGTGTISISGGKLSAVHLRQAGLSIGGNAQVVIASGGGNAGVSRAASLSIDTAGTAKFDLADNGLVVDYSTGSPMANIRSAIQSAYGGGNWSGPGLTSSVAAANPLHGLSYVEAADLLKLSATDGGIWRGQSVDATTVLVSDALVGDSDLSGAVDFGDLTKVAQNYGKSDWSASWFQGDFNYDGIVDFADLVKLAQNYGTGIPSAVAGGSAGFGADVAAAFASVPEPSMAIASLLGIGGIVIGRRRKMNSSIFYAA